MSVALYPFVRADALSFKRRVKSGAVTGIASELLYLKRGRRWGIRACGALAEMEKELGSRYIEARDTEDEDEAKGRRSTKASIGDFRALVQGHSGALQLSSVTSVRELAVIDLLDRLRVRRSR